MSEGLIVSNALVLSLMFIAGALLAAVYLAGLWFTVQGVCSGRYPGLWTLTSLLVRMALLAVAFYFVLGDGHWERLLAALAGFASLRSLAMRRVRHRTPDCSKKEKPA